MIREHDLVVSERDINEHHLVKGDVGTVVHCYAGGDAYEAEFVTGAGDTIVVLTLEDDHVRLLTEREILHVREMAVAYKTHGDQQTELNKLLARN